MVAVDIHWDIEYKNFSTRTGEHPQYRDVVVIVMNYYATFFHQNTEGECIHPNHHVSKDRVFYVRTNYDIGHRQTANYLISGTVHIQDIQNYTNDKDLCDDDYGKDDSNVYLVVNHTNYYSVDAKHIKDMDHFDNLSNNSNHLIIRYEDNNFTQVYHVGSSNGHHLLKDEDKHRIA